MIREQIMALSDDRAGNAFDIGKNLGLEIAANLAEAHERELLAKIENNKLYTDSVIADGTNRIQQLKAERAQMIAELRGLKDGFADWTIDGIPYVVQVVAHGNVENIINKYEVK